MKRVTMELFDAVNNKVDSIKLRRLCEADEDLRDCDICGAVFTLRSDKMAICGCMKKTFCRDCYSVNVFCCKKKNRKCHGGDSYGPRWCCFCLPDMEKDDWDALCDHTSLPCFGTNCQARITKNTGHASLKHEYRLVCLGCMRKEVEEAFLLSTAKPE